MNYDEIHSKTTTRIAKFFFRSHSIDILYFNLLSTTYKGFYRTIDESQVKSEVFDPDSIPDHTR